MNEIRIDAVKKVFVRNSELKDTTTTTTTSIPTAVNFVSRFFIVIFYIVGRTVSSQRQDSHLRDADEEGSR